MIRLEKWKIDKIGNTYSKAWKGKRKICGQYKKGHK